MSAMYEAYWGLRAAPFEGAPNPKFLSLSPGHEEALARLVRAVAARQGAALLSGEPGCGKTVLSRALLHRLPPARFEVALVVDPGGSACELLKEMLYQLGAEHDGVSRRELVRRLHERLFQHFQGGRDTVIVLDEAQRVEADEVFEELRLLLNFQTDERFLLTVVLIGEVELVARLARHPALAQRMAAHAHLSALDAEHTARYIAHRLAVAGRDAPIFTAAAAQRVHAATAGVPRGINAVCDLALLLGYERRRRAVDEELVVEAAPSGAPLSVR